MFTSSIIELLFYQRKKKLEKRHSKTKPMSISKKLSQKKPKIKK